jgi:hypothetical protein
MRGIETSTWLLLAGLLLTQGPGFSQNNQQCGSFILSGHSGQVRLIQLNGRPLRGGRRIGSVNEWLP